jgi:signal transduction histidine kinase
VKPRNLRYRVALFFASFGAVISLALSLPLYLAAKDLGQRLVDETLTAELDDYIARRERNPNSLPPATVTLHGYVQEASSLEALPTYLRSLLPGRHNVRVGDSSYRVAVVDVQANRYYLLFDASAQQRRETQLAVLLGVLVVAVTMFSGLGGIALAGSVMAPVTELAMQVRTRGPDDWVHPLADGFAHDEVGELARVFDRHTARMRAFIERERALTADMSHELRTSLAVILSATEMLLSDGSLTDRQRKILARIDRAARDMAELGTALLLMAREESSFASGGGCVVASVVEEAVEKHRHLLRKKPVRVDIRTDPGLEVQADRGLVDIMVSNLIRNAYSYTDSGTITVRQDSRELTVSDTGRGIPGNAMDQVFLRHFKDAASEGAGIGLSLVKRICDRYGWHIRLESRENEGTTISIRFQ